VLEFSRKTKKEEEGSYRGVGIIILVSGVQIPPPLPKKSSLSRFGYSLNTLSIKKTNFQSLVLYFLSIRALILPNIAKIKKSIIRRLYPPTLQINEPIQGPAILPNIKQIARIP